MKKRLLGTLVFLFCTSGMTITKAEAKAAAETQQSILLSHAEFLQLSHTDQKNYVRMIRDMMVEMERKDPAAAAEFFNRAPWVAQLFGLGIQEANAQSSQAKKDPVQVAEGFLTNSDQLMASAWADVNKAASQEQKLNVQERYRNSLLWLGIAAGAANNISDDGEKKAMKAKIQKAYDDSVKVGAEVEKHGNKDEFKKLREDYVKPTMEGNKAVATKEFPQLKTIRTPEAQKKAEAERAKAASTSASSSAGLNQPAGIKTSTVKVGTEDTAAAPAAPPIGTAPAAKAAPAAPAAPVVPAPRTQPAPAAATAKQSHVSGEGGSAPKQQAPRPDPAGEKATAKTGEKTGDKPQEKAPEQAANKSADKDTNKDADVAADGKTGDKTTKRQKPEDEKKGFRCMYTGFVIKTAQCVGPNELPFDLANINKDTFRCSGGKAMCNPLVFGAKADCNWKEAAEKGKLADCWKSAKPVCVSPRGDFPTKECANETSSTDAIDATVEIIKANPEAYNSFAREFNGLCNLKHINYNIGRKKPRSAASRRFVKNDVDRTCEVATEAAHKMRDRFKERYPGLYKEADAEPKDGGATDTKAGGSKAK